LRATGPSPADNPAFSPGAAARIGRRPELGESRATTSSGLRGWIRHPAAQRERRVAGPRSVTLSPPAKRHQERLTSQPRMRRLYEAAITTGGDLRAMADRMGQSGHSLRLLLSRLRSIGAARVAILFDPRRCGRPCEVHLRVQLGSYTRADAASFEAYLQIDPAVTSAAQITGRDDYQIIAFHKDIRAADRWARELGDRGEIARVRLVQVRTLFGHHLLGAPLNARLQGVDGPVAAPARHDAPTHRDS